MDKTKKTKKTIYIIISIVLFSIMTFCFLIPKNKTFASEIVSGDDFIKQYEYTLSLGTLSQIVVYDDGTYWEYSIDNCYLSSSGTECYFSYPTLLNNTNNNYEFNQYTYTTVLLDKHTNSERTRYTYNTFANLSPLIVSAVRYTTDGGQRVAIAGDLQVTYIEINLPNAYTISDLFKNNLKSRELLYRRNVNTGYGTESLLTSNKRFYDFNVDSPLLTSYISTTNLSGDTSVILPTNYIYQDEVIKIDRSEYVNTIYEIVYVDPIDNPIKAIVNGVGNFFNTELFPNFKLGNIFVILLGVSFFGFVLHLLVK